ncbi:MAG: hypothetical protein JW940_16275 [Polyangiaceae bacterium]|nr:hypothetical protein [Polyangiaceae bacterium]
MTIRLDIGQLLPKDRVLLLAIAVGLSASFACGTSDSGDPAGSGVGGGTETGGNAPTGGATMGSGGRTDVGVGGRDSSGGTVAGGAPTGTGGPGTTPASGGQGEGGTTKSTGSGGQTAQDTGGQGLGGETTAPGSGGQALGGSGQTGGTVGRGGRSAGIGGGSATTGGTTGSGGQSTSGGQGGAAAGGTSAVGGQTGAGGATGSCVPTKTWGTADPAKPGPFEIQVENNIGPAAGEPDERWDNQVPHFNLYRPKDLSQGYCHPIVTWANGTGDQPPTYEVLIKQLATHGFVVVASLSSQSAKGTPLPQIAGIEWMIQENEDPSSPLYHHLDTAHIGATGHSQGGAATTLAGADPRITAIAPICGSRANITLHGPAALLCGGSDTMVSCSSVESAYDTINDVPVMLFNSLADTHGSWIGSIQNPFMVAVTGWMRVHLMGDTDNRSLFYGASCKFCSDSRVSLKRKMMDE